MQKRGFWNWLSKFVTGYAAAELVWRIFAFVVILGGGTATAFVAKARPVLMALGPIYWIGVGVIAALIFSIILYLIKSSGQKQAQADLFRVMAVPRSTINPLSSSFMDSIIPIEDLRLPIVQLHENKLFKRCKFVGPGALAIMGGTYVKSGFPEIGDIIALPDNVSLAGIVVFKNCTVEDCEFIRITIFADQNTARGFAAAGASVKGLSREGVITPTAI